MWFECHLEYYIGDSKTMRTQTRKIKTTTSSKRQLTEKNMYVSEKTDDIILIHENFN